MSRERWMALCFAVGSACFMVGPFPGYEQLVGAQADAVTFFVGSVLFTIGGALQVSLSLRESHAMRWVAGVQSAGTLFFNATTFRAMDTSVSSSGYDHLVWRPDALGSICFLVSGAIAYHASARHGWRPLHEAPGWWEPAVNLLGCVLFGVSAVAGYVVPSSGSVLDLAAANFTTVAGAACFFACAVGTLVTGRTHKAPRLARLRALEHAAERDAARLVASR